MDTMHQKRIARKYETILDAQPEQIFPLFCPDKEREWIPYWQCSIHIPGRELLNLAVSSQRILVTVVVQIG